MPDGQHLRAGSDSRDRVARLSDRKGLRFRELALAGAHLAVLWSFAIAQPLLDLLGDAPEFFVARGNTRADIVVLALVVTFVPPLLLTAVEALAGLISARLREALHLVFVAVLCAAFLLQLLKDAGGGAALPIALATAGGVVAAVAYARMRAAPQLLTVLAPAPLLFLVLFLGVAPVSKLVLPGAEAKAADVKIPGRTPVVVLVFDELSGLALLGPDGRIDASRYPNFARLAGDASWYRNATTVSDFTDHALPALLTGNVTERGSAPIASDHPNNLFTLLGGTYSFDVTEPVTDLCPHRLCPSEADEGDTRGQRWRDLVSDLSLVSLHLLLPDELADGLQPVDRSFGDFRTGGDGGSDDASRGASGRALEAFASITERVQVFEAFQRRLARPSDGADLAFLHLQMPHNPYHFLPSGQRYPDPLKSMPGLEPSDDFAGGAWNSDPGVARQALERYLLQVRYTDRMLGRVLDRLEANGSYDRSLVAVLADHGASFTPGQPHRSVTAGNLTEIASIPLFVKAPGQRRGQVNDDNVHITDLLPTLSDRLGVRLPWDVDGRVADRAGQGGTVTVRPTRDAGDVSLPFEEFVRRRDALVRRNLAAFPPGAAGLFEGGPAAELIGRSVGSLGAPEGAGRFTLTGAGLLADVDPGAGIVPGLVSGRVYGLPDDARLAVAVDGRVAASAVTFREGGSERFAAVVPADAFRPGPADVELIASTRAGLRRLRGSLAQYRLVGDEAIVDGAGGRYRIAAGPPAGYLEALTVDPAAVSARGWAGATEPPHAARLVVAFAGDAFLGSVRPSLPRPDLERRYGQQLAEAGFELSGWAAGPRPGSPQAPIRVFAIVGRTASELPEPPPPSAAQRDRL
jgi:hypothetical protein